MVIKKQPLLSLHIVPGINISKSPVDGFVVRMPRIFHILSLVY
jgi:hypothetical protein